MGGVINILPPAIPAEGLHGSWQTMARSNNNYLGSSLMLEGNKKGYFIRLRSTLSSFGDYKVPADSFTYLNRTLPIYNHQLKNTAGKELHFAATHYKT